MATNFIESPRFPDDMAYWATGGAQHNTTVVQLNSGFEQRNVNWSQQRANYTISSGLRTQKNINKYSIEETIAFFNAVQGRAYGFRFKDFQDYDVNLNNGVLESGFGNGYPTYQLCKNYMMGGLVNRKQIKKPVNNSSFKIYKNSNVLTVTTDYSVDFTKGIVTFVPTKNLNISSITTGNNPTVTTTSNHGLTVGQKIYLNNLNNGNVLNKLVFDILSTPTATTFTINATNASAVNQGNAQLYPQATDLLRWTGEFDKACRFDNDNLDYGVTDGGLVEVNFKIVEIRV